MRNIYFTIALLIFVVSAGFAQTTNQYTYTTNNTSSLTSDLTGNPVDMTTGTTQLVAAGVDDGASGLATIGFPFTFMGTTYTQFSSSSNGAIRLGTTVIGTTAYGNSFPIAAPIIAPYWGDLATSSTGKVHYKLLGSYPNRTLVVEFLNMKINYSGTVDGTFQARLYEQTNTIEFVYGSMKVGGITTTTSRTVAIGFENAAGANNQISLNQATYASNISATPTLNTNAATGTLAGLNSVADGSRRGFVFTPALPYHAQFISLNSGATAWCPAESRTVTVKIKNIGTATWTEGSPDINVGIKWNTNGANWTDYYIRVDAGNLAPGATGTYNLPITASNNTGSGYTTGLAAGTNNLILDVVYEGVSWFGDNGGGVGPGNTKYTSPAITITSAPVISVQPSPAAQNICLNSSSTALTVTASGTGITYQWYSNTSASNTGGTLITGAVFASFTPPTTTVGTTYYYCIVSGSCTPATSSVSGAIKINAKPTAGAITGAANACIGSTSALTANAAGSGTLTYTWNSSATGVATVSNAGVITPLGTGSTNITYTVTDGNSCSATSANFVVSVTKPVAGAITGATKVCIGNSITLSSNATGVAPLTYTWSSSATSVATVSGTGVVSGLSTGSTNITYTVTDGNNCSTTSAIFTVTITKPTALAITGASTVCIGSNITLASHATGSGTLTYTWLSSNAAVASVSSAGIVNGNATGTTSITYTVTDGNGCSTTSPAFDITVTKPSAGAISGASEVCVGSTITLSSNATGAGTLTYTWSSSNASVASVSNTGIVSGLATGLTNISYTVTDGNSCAATSAAFAVTVNARPTAVISSGNVSICNNGGNTNITGTVTATGTWTLVLSNGATATGNGNGTFSINVSPVTTTTYSISSLNDTKCNAIATDLTGSETVTVNEPIAITTQPDATQISCATFPVSFSVNATGTGLTYQWYFNGTALTDNSNISGSATATLNIDQVGTTDAGTYYVIVSGLSPCSPLQSGNSVLTVNQEIVINTQPLPQILCAGSTATFTIDASGTGIMYQWRKGTTVLLDGGTISGVNTSTLTITNVNAGDAATNYNVVLTSPGGFCPQANSANVQLKVNPIPDVNASPVAPFICSGNSPAIALSGSVPSTTFTWTVVQTGVSGATAGSGGSINDVLTTTGTTAGTADYTIIPTASSCPGTPVTVRVTVNPKPDVVATPASQTICSGTAPSIALTGTVSGTIYNWTVVQSGVTGASAGSGAFINQTLSSTSSTAGTAVYTITPSANGCNGSTVVVTITVNPIPVVTVTPASQTICSGATSSVALTSNVSGTAFTWTVVQSGVTGAVNGSGSSIAQMLTATGTTSGTAIYSIASSAGTCNGTPVNVTVTVNPRPNVVATPVAQTICSNTATSIALTSPVANTTFSWTVAQSGVSGAAASSGTSIAQTLAATGAVAGTATYTITPSANGCPGTSITATITVNPVVTVAPLTQAICNGNAITTIAVSGAVAGTITSWTRDNPSGITSSISTSGTGSISGTFTNSNAAATTVTFTLNLTASNGCQTIKTVTVIVDATLTAPVISATQIVCTGSTPAPLSSTAPTGGTGSGYTYQWYYSANAGGPWTLIAGATGTTYTPPTTTRYYQLIVSNSCGSVATNVVQISTAADFGLSFDGNDPASTLCSGSSFSYTLTSASISGSLGGSRYIRYSWQSQDAGFYTSPTTNPYGATHAITIFGIPIFTYFDGTATFTVHNSSNIPVTENLLITPNIYNSDGTPYCNLSPQIITVTINPVPVIANYTATTCSGSAFTISPVNGAPTAATIVPTGTTYAWSAPVVTGGITGGSAQSGQSSISQTLTNPTNIAQTATYTVIPTYIGSPNCPGAPFTIVVTVNPKPVIPAQAITICNNATFTVTPSATIVPAGTTYSWSAPVVTGGITGGSGQSNQTSISQTLSNPTTTIQTATYTVTPTSGAAGSCPGTAFTLTVTVNPVPTATISASAAIVCQGSATSVIFTGTANTIVTYTVNSGANQTIAIGASGTATLATGNLSVNTTYSLVSIAFSPALCSRSISGTVIITVNPTATAAISASPLSICQGQSATFTFTGTANAVVTYKVGSGINQTITLNASGTASISGALAATTTYTLISVGYASTPNCTQPLTATATVTVNANANAGVISGTSPLCINGTATYTSNGNAGGVWSSSNTSVATVTSAGLVNAVAAGTANIIYTVNTGCNSPVSVVKILTVSPNAAAGIVSGSSPICVNAQVSYSASGGNAGGVWASSNTAVATVSATGIVKGIANGTSIITYTVSTGCNAPVSSSQSVQVLNAAPASSPGAISGPLLICSSTTGFVYSVSPVANASTYLWTVPSGWSVTSGAGTNSITVTSGTTGGNISVIAGNSCGFSAASNLTVAVSIAGQWRGITADWNDPQNWCSGVPTVSSNVYIPVGTPNDPVISTAVAFTKNIVVQSGATVTINGNTLKIAGTVTSTSSINALNGSIEMVGVSPQAIAGSMFKAKTVNNLILSNSNGVILSGANDTLKLSGLLSFGNSNVTLNTNGNLTLLSSAAGTASVGDMTAAGLYGGNHITGNTTVERYIPNHTKAWQFLAVPTKGQSINQSWQEGNSSMGNNHPGYGTIITSNITGATSLGFDIYTASGPSMKTYNPVTNAWDGVPGVNVPIANTEGYMFFVRGDRSVTVYNQPANVTVLRTSGTLYTSGVDAPPVTNVFPGKLASVGNPYASAIDFTLITKSLGIDDKFYVWDPLLTNNYNGLGGYQTISSVTGWKPTPGGTANYDANTAYQTIQSGQAFFVFSTFGGGTVSFTEGSKVNGSMLVNRQQAGNAAQRQIFRTSLYNGITSDAKLSDGTTAVFDPSFSKTIDANDAMKIMNATENIGIYRNDKNLSVEARSPVSEADTLFYSLNNLRKQPYQLRFVPENMALNGLTAFVADRFLNSLMPLDLTTSSSYDFVVTNDNASAAADRFYIVFKPSVILPVTFTSVKAYQQEKNIQVEWKVESQVNVREYVVEKSVDGISFKTMTVKAADGNNGLSLTYFATDEHPLTGNNYYRIKSIDFDGSTRYSNIVKVFVKDIKPLIAIYPNPITDGLINLQLINQPAGSYDIKLYDTHGQVMLSKQITRTEGSSTEKIKWDYQVAHGTYLLEVIQPDGNKKVIKVLY